MRLGEIGEDRGEREDVRSLVRGERKRGGEKKAEVYKIVLVIKNRKQMEKSEAQIPENWKGKLVFADGIGNQLGKFFGKLFDRD